MEGPKEVVLVTGASSGFGRSLVESLAQNGYQVLASMREASGRNATANAELRSLAEKEGLSLQVVELDVTNEESVDAAVKELVSWAGRIDVLVNNAGVAYRGATEAFTVEQVRELFDVNFFGVLRMNRAVLPYMRKQGRGLLILMSSAGGQVVYPFMGLYSASKFAAEAMSISYRYDLSRFGIDSVIVQPGWHPTPILGKQVRPADVGRLTELEILSEHLEEDGRRRRRVVLRAGASRYKECGQCGGGPDQNTLGEASAAGPGGAGCSVRHRAQRGGRCRAG